MARVKSTLVCMKTLPRSISVWLFPLLFLCKSTNYEKKYVKTKLPDLEITRESQEIRVMCFNNFPEELQCPFGNQIDAWHCKRRGF